MGSAHQAHGNDALETPSGAINAKATVLWVSALTVFLFLGMWLLLVLFDHMVMAEQQRKIDQYPAGVELDATRAKEQQFLNCEWEEGVKRKSIDDVMKEMAK